MRRLVLFLVIYTLPVFADTKGSARGKVSDPSGAMIVGAVVTFTNVADGRTFQTATYQQGEYEFDFVQAGLYRLSVSASGFQPVEQHATVISGQRIELNLRLALSYAPTTAITVTDSAEQIELRNNAVQQ